MTHVTLVFPGGIEEGLAFAIEAKAKNEAVIGGSSLFNDPAREEYDHWVRLPYVSSPDFDRELSAVIQKHGVTRIYAPHNVIWIYFDRLRQGLLADVEIVNIAPQMLIQEKYRALKKRLTHARPYDLSLPRGADREQLTTTEVLALFFHANRIYGATDSEKMAGLIEIFLSAPPGDIVEIGCLAGRSAFLLGWLARKYQLGQLLCIDPWSNASVKKQQEHSQAVTAVIERNDFNIYFELFITNMLGHCYGVVNYLRSESMEAFKNYSLQSAITSSEFGTTVYCREISILHIDGNHDYAYVNSDIRQWTTLLKPGGWLVVDDYQWAFGDGPKRALDQYLEENFSLYELAFVMGGAMFMRKSA